MNNKNILNYEKVQKNKKMKIGIIAIVLLVVFIFIYFLMKNNYKNLNFGNNMSNKNIEEIEEYILNISSYSAKIEVTVESNKNQNKYVLTQKYTSPNLYKQVVIQPSNIAGLETIYDGINLTLNNSNLSASTVYENYEPIVENFLWLNVFIEDYKQQKEKGNTKLEEENNCVVMDTKTRNENNQYVYYKKLYIDRKTGKPTKLFIQDINKKNLVYILYNEIEVNGLQREETLAFKDVYSKYNI